jgi:hypothetical protein
MIVDLNLVIAGVVMELRIAIVFFKILLMVMMIMMMIMISLLMSQDNAYF